MSLSNYEHVLSVESPTRVSGAKRTHDPHVNTLAHYSLEYQGAPKNYKISAFQIKYVSDIG